VEKSKYDAKVKINMIHLIYSFNHLWKFRARVKLFYIIISQYIYFIQLTLIHPSLFFHFQINFLFLLQFAFDVTIWTTIHNYVYTRIDIYFILFCPRMVQQIRSYNIRPNISKIYYVNVGIDLILIKGHRFLHWISNE
jgi:hypothetical protein